MNYHSYLASRQWGLKKVAVRKRCNGICERCLSAPQEVVHHKTYDRIYKEPLTDLQGLCRPCHAFVGGHSDHDPALDVLFGVVPKPRGEKINTYRGVAISWDKDHDQRLLVWLEKLPEASVGELLAVQECKANLSLSFAKNAVSEKWPRDFDVLGDVWNVIETSMSLAENHQWIIDAYGDDLVVLPTVDIDKVIKSLERPEVTDIPRGR